MTSSLNLPSSIKTIGRHGSCSEVLSMFGMHILMKKHETEVVFIPNREWLPHMNKVIEKINSLANNISSLHSLQIKNSIS